MVKIPDFSEIFILTGNKYINLFLLTVEEIKFVR